MKPHATVSVSTRLTTLCLLAVGTLGIVGCSYDDEGRTSSLAGRITLDSQPIESGSVLLLTENGDGAGAEINDDGTFELRCKPGTYLVAILPPEETSGPDGVPTPSTDGQGVEIPRKYTDVGTSLLTVSVTEGENSAEFALTSQ